MNSTFGQDHRKKYIRIVLALLVLLEIVLLGVWLRNAIVNTHVYKYTPPLSKVVYGVNVDITAMIPGSGYTVRTASGGNFFDLASQLGINTLRITDVRWTTTGQPRSRTTWNYVFDQAAKYKINIILLLVDSNNSSALDEAHILLGDYGLAHASALWMVDLNNEPDVSDPQNMAELRKEAAYVRQVAPKVPITIGGWKSEIPGSQGKFDWQDPKDIPSIINLVDVVSPHLYGFTPGNSPRAYTRSYLSDVRNEAHGKPILLEEFGAGNGLATTTESTPTGSPTWQAYVYQGVFQEVSAEHIEGVMGAVAWIMAPRPVPPHSSSPQGDMTGWAFVLDHGQQILPAAHQFSTVAHTS